MYKNNEYLTNNPSWHIEDSPWKAKHIVNMMMAHNIQPTTLVEVGCGGGRF